MRSDRSLTGASWRDCYGVVLGAGDAGVAGAGVAGLGEGEAPPAGVVVAGDGLVPVPPSPPWHAPKVTAKPRPKNKATIFLFIHSS